MCYTALEGLPGPYIKWFLEKLKCKGLFSLLNAHENKEGFALCVFGFGKNSKTKQKIFSGKCEGVIVEERGKSDFGWETIFQPKDQKLTYAEMDLEEKNKISERFLGLKKLIEFLKENKNYLN